MNKILLIGLIVISAFSMGFLTSNIYADSTRNIEQPVTSTSPNSYFTDEVQSPNDWIKEKQIGVYSKNVILDIQDAQWATFTDTHSMEPVLSSRANAIELVPKTVDELKVGDIVSYKSEYAGGTIIHRIIEKSEDDLGVYFILKGDNNQYPDPGKVRFSQIQRVVVAIIY